MLRRILIRVVLFSLLGLATTAAAIHIEQRLLRTRAEDLLEDIRSLELRRSTWTDAQRVFTRWGAWGHYEGSCGSPHCDYEVSFGDIFVDHSRLVPDAPWARRAFEFFGVRMSLVTAHLLVTDGLVLGKEFTAFIEVPPDRGPIAPFSGSTYTLIGRVETRTFPLSGSLHQHSIHPEYTVMSPSGCTGCLTVWVRFTPLADPVDVRRLMDFNLACLTNHKPCREREDIMPSAWKQHLAEVEGIEPAK
jgi:hypothetical protein